MRARAMALCACVLAAGSPLAGQSILAAGGLGVPVEGLDGRARALGSLGIGLQGASVTPSDPAAAARMPLASGILVAQPSWVELIEAGQDEQAGFQGTRFPLLAFAIPAAGGTFTLHATSVFDQNFSGERTSDVVIDGSTFTATDQFLQDGSISSLGVGYARMLGQRAAVGLQVGRYSGTVTRTLVRDFGDPTGLDVVEPYVSEGVWEYSGASVTGGASAELGSLRVAASANWSTDIEADASDVTAGGDASFSIPLQLRLGLSSRLTQGLTLSASGMWADWTVAADDVGEQTRARTVYGFGAGLELSQGRLLGREAPLRVGFRRSGLPFAVGGGDGTEQAFSGGLALVLSQTEGVVLASADVGVERGWRQAGSVKEEFWRATASVRLSTF